MIRRLGILTLVLTICLLALLAPSAGAKAGDLDPSFSADGYTWLAKTDNLFGRVGALQPDGKYVVAGLVQSSPYRTCIAARYLPNGVIDSSFGENGTHTLNTGNSEGCTLTAMEITPTGRILISGSTDPDGSTAGFCTVWGLTAGGKDDNGWGVSGFTGLDGLAGNPDECSDMSLLPDGNVLAIASSSFAANSVVYRFASNGSYDAGFSAGGHGAAGSGYMNKLHGLSDGRFVVAGKVNDGGEAFRIARLAATGTGFDTTFGSAGKFTTTIPGDDSGVTDMVVQPDGKIILAGSGFSNGKYRAVLLRLTADGAPDPTFGVGGAVLARFQEEDYFKRVAVAPDGKIVAVGNSLAFGVSGYATLVARYNPDGTLDTGFGNGGHVLNVFGNVQGEVRDVSVAADGNISVVGQVSPGGPAPLAVARILGNTPVVPAPATALIKSPSKKRLKAKKLKSFSGTATGDGITKVELALVKADSKLLKKKKRCLQLSSKKGKFSKTRAVKKKCPPSKWLAATGTTSWSYKLKKVLPAGKYALYVRATGTAGVQSTPTKKSFTLTK